MRKPRSLDDAKPKPKAKAKAPSLDAPTVDDYISTLRGMKDVEEEDFGLFSDEFVYTDVGEWVPTGSIVIDRLTGGGWPVGRISEVAAWESVGKSTLLDQSIAQCQRIGGVACLIDTEQSRDKVYTKRLGVDLDRLIIHPAETIEESFAGIDKVLDAQEKLKTDLEISASRRKVPAPKPPILFIVWDSIGGTPTASERDGAADDRHVSDAARSIKMNFRRITLRVAKLRAALVVSNHFYTSIGPFASLVSYGGSGIRYLTSLRVWLTRKERLKIGTVEVGHAIEAKLKKTRISRPRPPAELGLVWGAGIDNSYSLMEWGRDHGTSPQHRWITQAGPWYYLHRPDGTYEAFQRSFVGFGELLASQPAVYEQMAAQFLSEET
jgi:recombination protein RecA